MQSAMGQARKAPDGSPIVVAVGQSKVLDAPWPAQKVSITNPQIADVEAISPTQVLLMGKKVGTTDLVMWSASGEVWQRSVEIHIDLPRMRKELAGLFPNSDLEVVQSQDVVIVKGTLQNPAQISRLKQFLDAAEKSTGLKYMDMVSLTGVPRPTGPGPQPAREQMSDADLTNELRLIFPDAKLEARQSGAVIVVSGVLRRTEQAEQLKAYLDALQEQSASRQAGGRVLLWPSTGPAPEEQNPEASARQAAPRGQGLRFINMTSVAGVQQVQLQVRIAEVSRTALRSLGVNILQTGHHDNTFFGGSTIGPSVGGAIVPMNIGPPAGALAGGEHVPFTFNSNVNIPPSVTLFLGFPRADLEFFLESLAENYYLRLLAEPSLLALSGEEASFLAGGEFPVPVVQGGGSTAGVSVTIEWKEFGVRLRFRPTVLGDGTIRLHLAPEVSELVENGAVVIQGFRVPSVATRRAETTLELASGQSFAMAGLLSSRNEGRNSRTPGPGDVPVLGALFRSVRYQKGETELVVLVTASLVEPLSLACPPPLPGVTHVEPNDWEFYAGGMLEGRAAPKLSPSDAAYFQELGLDQLHGPGAWAAYDQQTARSNSDIRTAPPPAEQLGPVTTAPAGESLSH